MTNDTSISDDERRAQRSGFDMLGRLLFGAAAFQTLPRTVRTGLLDVLRETESGLDRTELAGRIRVRGRWLDTLLTAACAAGLVVRDPDGRYAVTEALRPAVRGGEWELFKATVAFEHSITYRGIEMFTDRLSKRPTRASTDSRATQATRSTRALPATSGYARSSTRTCVRGRGSAGQCCGRALPSFRRSRLLDVGGGDGVHAIASVNRIPGLRVTIVDLAEAVDVSRSRIAEAGLAGRIVVVGADIFADEFPRDMTSCFLRTNW